MNPAVKEMKTKLSYATGEERLNLLISIVKTTQYTPHKEAQKLIAEAVELAQSLGTPSNLIKTYHIQAEVFRQAEQMTNYKKVLEKALIISKKLEDKTYYVHTLRALGQGYYYQSRPFEARPYFEQALQEAKSNHLLREELWAYNCIGNTYVQNLLYDKATAHFLQAIELAKEKGDLPMLGASYYNLSLAVRDTKKSIRHLKEALPIFEELKMKNSILKIYSMLSIKYIERNDTENALQCAQQSLKIAEETQANNHLYMAYSVLSTSLFNKAKQQKGENVTILEEAYRWSTKMLDLSQKNDRTILYHQTRLLQGQIQHQMGNYSHALELLEELIPLLEQENDSGELSSDIAHSLSKLYESMGNFEQALQFYKIHTQKANAIKDVAIQKNTEALHTQYETKQKEAEVTRLQEMEVLKTRFFSQITHELRTPLSLILGPAQYILQLEEIQAAHFQAEIVERNAKRLLQLVNQLLDISKLEAGKMKLNNSHGFFTEFVENTIQAFQTLATQQQIQLDFVCDMDEFAAHFDRDKMEKILYNLLSNAFKFTPTQGQIIFQLSALATSNRATKQIELSVSDTGQGIAEEELPHIFDRFYQVDNSYIRKSEGTGIGLSLVKEITDLMGGKIRVKSSIGGGSTFTLQLPLELSTKDNLSFTPYNWVKKERSSISVSAPIPPKTALPPIITPTKNAPVLLLIEDNHDIHDYIRSVLEKEYIFLQAYDGKEGLKVAQERVPDLIISDVMMPEKDGYQVCRELKENFRTSHIPVVLLTAKGAMESRIEGLEQGADAYLSKPFHMDELKLQINNLIATRQNLYKKYNALTFVTSPTPTKTDKESQFLKRVVLIIEKYLDDEGLNVNRLSELMHLSTSQLYRKIHALTNSSTSEFIRQIRLAKAKVMLESGQGNVSEIAYQVGLTPHYFSKCFVKQYGFPPKTLLK